MGITRPEANPCKKCGVGLNTCAFAKTVNRRPCCSGCDHS